MHFMVFYVNITLKIKFIKKRSILVELKDIIIDYKERYQLTNDDIAARIGVTKSTVSRWISGDVKRIQEETLQRLNELLGFDITPILKGTAVHYSRPILGQVKAGYNMYVDECKTGDIQVSETDYLAGDYFLKVNGDSMSGSGIMDGDLVLVKQCSSVHNGQIAVIIVGEEVTIKRIIQKPDLLILEATNPLVENRYYTPNDIENLPVKIIGRVIYSQTYF